MKKLQSKVVSINEHTKPSNKSSLKMNYYEHYDLSVKIVYIALYIYSTVNKGT